MKKRLALLLLGTLFLTTNAFAQANPPAPTPQTPMPAKVGIINTQLAIISTAEGKKAVEELQTQYAPKRTELEKMQKEIQDLQNQLRVQERTLSSEAATDLRRQIDAKTKEFNRQGEDTQEEFQKKESELVNRIGQKMLRVIDRYAQDNGYTVILDVSSPQTPVLYAAMSVDITSDIIKLYDVTYKVEAPAATTPPAARPAPRPAQPPAEAKKPSPPPSRP